MNVRLAMALLLTGTGLATAQVPTVQQPAVQPIKPVYSPYLNLLRNNAPVYQNYYGTVLPQLQQQAGINALQQQVTGLQNAAQQNYYPNTGGELATGKQVGYFTHRGYFLNSGGIGVNRGYTGQYGTAGNNSIYQGSGAQPAGSTGPNGLSNPLPNTPPIRR